MDPFVMPLPIISVLMPVYNCEQYIREAVDSILNQTYADFELLVIDDASSDGTVSILKSYKDSRIQLIEKPINTGYTNSLNLGLQLAKGRYIARMDGDDISLAERFSKQVAFLEDNPKVILCGTWYSIMGSDRIVKLPERHDVIKVALLKGNCFAHPSVMIRKQCLEGFSIVYDVSKEPAEDYDLWVRLVMKGNLHNLQEVLLDYRTHSNQVTKKQSDKQKDSVLKTKRNLFNFLELDLLPNEELVLNKVLNNGAAINFNDIYIFKKLQNKLLASNKKYIFEPVAFKKSILDLETIIVNSYFLKRNRFTPRIYFEYLRIKNSLNFKLNLNIEIKLAIKSLIFYKP
ncbi:glycosyltransferase family 2 protein [Flavobacterium sp. WC2416]|uniref:Glycosyltransferase family 2 protein n=1 Tax=Flavobacterium sp. WC2416 TaxID=3234141 RepID=A0AB39WD42_9FLAO